MKRTFIPLFLVALSLSSCGGETPSSVEPSTSETPSDTFSVNDMELYVYDERNQITLVNLKDDEVVSYSYEGDNIRIENNRVIALKANTVTTVNAKTSKNRETSFKVTIPNRPYTSTHEKAENDEGWFNKISVNKVNNMKESFANGMDISSCKQLYDNGQQFYNADGVEQSLFYILKDAGVNWIRLRLWNDPKDEYEEDGQTKVFEYGGGNCHLDNVAWMAHEAKAAGLKVLLDFHYSDFWAHPGQQVMPKAWANLDSTSKVAAALKSYTYESLKYLKDNDATPDMVAVGNEITTGMLLQKPGGVTKTGQINKNPLYIEDRTTNYETRGLWDQTTNKDSNQALRSYLRNGVQACKEFDPNLKVMIHIAKGWSAYDSTIKNFYELINDINYDVIGLSGYLYNQGKVNYLTTAVNYLSSAFPNKEICIAETSYGFTYEQDRLAANEFNDTTASKSGYPCSIQGQASVIRDISEAVANISNGLGVFYWESAWTPTKKSGWADYSTKISWANQALFSYNGKALGSLEVYKQMMGK